MGRLIAMDIAEISGAAVKVTLAGEPFPVEPFTLRKLGHLQGWFKREIPSPALKAAEAIDRADRLGAKLSTRARDLLADAAVRAEASWPPKVGSLPWLRAIDDADRLDGLIFEALRPTNPDMTAERCRELAEGASQMEVSALLLAVLYGRTPDPLPKAEAPGQGPTTTPNPNGPSGTTGAAPSTP